MKALGGVRCVRCGFDDIRALQIDHVAGDGASHRRASPTNGNQGTTLYGAIIRGTVDRARFQVLCANCQWIKKAEDEEVVEPDDRTERAVLVAINP